MVEDRAALESILDTLDTQLPCLEGVLSSSSAPGTFTWRLSSPCLKIGILIPPSFSGGLQPRGIIDLPSGGLDLISGGRLSLGGGVSGLLDRVVFAVRCCCSYAPSSSLSSLPLVPIHTPTPTAFRPLRLLFIETLQTLP